MNFLYSVSVIFSCSVNNFPGKSQNYFLSGSVNDILDELNGEDEMRDSRFFRDDDDRGTLMIISLTSVIRASVMNIPASRARSIGKLEAKQNSLKGIPFSLVVWFLQMKYGHMEISLKPECRLKMKMITIKKG